jgi:hypothetical protein
MEVTSVSIHPMGRPSRGNVRGGAFDEGSHPLDEAIRTPPHPFVDWLHQ